MKCEKCGAENPDEVKFCGKCGSPLTSQPTIGAGKSDVGEVSVGAGKSSVDDAALAAGKSDVGEVALGAGKSGVVSVAAETNENEVASEQIRAEDIVNSDDIVTEQMTDAFNNQRKSTGQLTDDGKKKVKLEYFKSISKNPDVHTQQYDPKLVEVEDDGKIRDKNHTNVVIMNALKYWGLIGGGVIVLIILLTMSSLFDYNIIRGILLIFELMICGMMFLGIILHIGEFISFVRSSRDGKFKLISAIHILPIIVLLSILIYFFGIETTVMFIIGFVVIGIIGLICMAVMGKR